MDRFNKEIGGFVITDRAVFTWLSKGIGFGFTTPFGSLVYLLWFWFYDSQVKTALMCQSTWHFHTPLPPPPKMISLVCRVWKRIKKQKHSETFKNNIQRFLICLRYQLKLNNNILNWKRLLASNLFQILKNKNDN